MNELHDPTLTARAIALYKPPFKFVLGYIFDAEDRVVADDHEMPKEGISRIRGWGRISYLPDAAALQDECGRIVAQALTEFWERQK